MHHITRATLEAKGVYMVESFGFSKRHSLKEVTQVITAASPQYDLVVPHMYDRRFSCERDGLRRATLKRSCLSNEVIILTRAVSLSRQVF